MNYPPLGVITTIPRRDCQSASFKTAWAPSVHRVHLSHYNHNKLPLLSKGKQLHNYILFSPVKPGHGLSQQQTEPIGLNRVHEAGCMRVSFFLVRYYGHFIRPNQKVHFSVYRAEHQRRCPNASHINALLNRPKICNKGGKPPVKIWDFSLFDVELSSFAGW